MILITGGTGFVGSHLIKRLRKDGVAVRALVRSESKARALADLGVELSQGDISDPASLDAAMNGCERVVHLVGIIQEGRGFTFQSVHVEGTRNALAAAKKAGVRHFFHQSALGTRPDAKSGYHKTKWQAEELVRGSGIPFTILRPSLIYGAGDQFTLRLADMVRLAPVLPIIGTGRSKVQPVYIDDVCACIAKAVSSEAFLGKTLEIGGPDELTYEEVTRAIADALGIKRPALHMPMLFMRAVAALSETVLPKPPVTLDQLIMLQEDNVCGTKDIRGAFGIEPVGFREGLAKFLGKRPASGSI